MKKVKCITFAVMALLVATAAAFADAPQSDVRSLDEAGFMEWMSEYLSHSLDTRNDPEFMVSSEVERTNSGGYSIIIGGYVNLGSKEGLDYVSRILPERLAVVEEYVSFWSSLGYNVDFTRDVEIAVRPVINRS